MATPPPLTRSYWTIARREVSGFDCGNCNAPSDQHSDGHCFFSPTEYRMMNAAELYRARNPPRDPVNRWGSAPLASKGPHTWHVLGASLAKGS